MLESKEKIPTVVLTARISEGMHRRVKSKLASEGSSFQELIEQAVKIHDSAHTPIALAADQASENVRQSAIDPSVFAKLEAIYSGKDAILIEIVRATVTAVHQMMFSKLTEEDVRDLEIARDKARVGEGFSADQKPDELAGIPASTRPRKSA